MVDCGNSMRKKTDMSSAIKAPNVNDFIINKSLKIVTCYKKKYSVCQSNEMKAT
jgi:hypothetical protein